MILNTVPGTCSGGNILVSWILTKISDPSFLRFTLSAVILSVNFFLKSKKESPHEIIQNARFNVMDPLEIFLKDKLDPIDPLELFLMNR